MKRKDIITLAMIAGVTAVLSFILTSLIFRIPVNHSLTVHTANSISATFPDIKNDSNYNTIFNKGELDPAQPLQLGNTQNQTPFNGSPQ